MVDHDRICPVFHLFIEASTANKARAEAAFCMSSLAEFDCKEFRSFMWKLSVFKVPEEKEEEVRFSKASMVGADILRDDFTDWDLLDEESWRMFCTGDSRPQQNQDPHPDNWWEARDYYDADYVIPMPDKDGLDL